MKAENRWRINALYLQNEDFRRLYGGRAQLKMQHL